MPHTCGVDSRGDSGVPGIVWSDAEIVIAMLVTLRRFFSSLEPCGPGLRAFQYVVVPAFAGTTVCLQKMLARQPASLSYPATSLMRAISSSTALSTGTFSLTTRFIAFAQTFSLFKIVNL